MCQAAHSRTWAPGQTLLFSLTPSPPTSKPGGLNQSLQESLSGIQECGQEKKIPQLCSLTSDYSYKFYFFQLQM